MHACMHTQISPKERQRERRVALPLFVLFRSEVEKGPYRLVVFSSFAAKAAWPKIPMQGFEGKLLHSSQFKAAWRKGRGEGVAGL